MRFTAIILASVVAFSLACSGETISPTSPGATARLDFIMSTTSSHTIRTVKMTFDGRDVTTVAIPGGGGQARLEGIVSGDRGRHTIRLIIVDQASSPNHYFAGGAITTLTRVMDMAAVQGVLATGEALEFTVNL